MRSHRTIYLILPALLVVCTWATFRWIGFTTSPASEPAVPASEQTGVVLAPVTVENLRQTIKAVGTLQANESLMIRPEIAGRIRQVFFQEGQAVERGALLIELDDSELQAELAQAAAQLKLSRLTYERLKQLDLDGKRYIPKQQLDEVAGSLEVSQSNHALYATRLNKTKIRSPFAGLTGIRRISPGDFVTIGQDLVNLEDVHTLKIDFKVPETLLRHLSLGQGIDLTTDAFPGETFHGAVYVIDPRVDIATRAVQVRARIPNGGERLRPGMFAQVTLIFGHQERALLIPEEAVIPKRDKIFVYRAEDGTSRLTEIQLGMRTRGFVQVLSGLDERDVVVRVGHHKLEDGARLRPLSTAPP